MMMMVLMVNHLGSWRTEVDRSRPEKVAQWRCDLGVRDLHRNEAAGADGPFYKGRLQ